MRLRGNVILVVGFFAGLIGLWWLGAARVPDRATREAAGPRLLPSLLETRPDEVRRIEIAGGPEPITFERRGARRWQMTAPIDAAADPSLVETLALNLKVLAKLPDAGTLSDDPKSLGLDPPRRVVAIFGEDRSKPLATLEVGSEVRSNRYARAKGAKGAEVVEARSLAALDLPAARWRDRMLTRLPSSSVRSVEATGPGRSVRLEREPGTAGPDTPGWRLVSPAMSAPADDDRVEGLLGELTGLAVVGGEGGFVADDVKDMAPYGLETPALSITLSPARDGGEPQTIHLGKLAPTPAGEPARTFARRGDQDDVVTVDARMLRDLGADPFDLHGKRVARFKPGRVVALRMKSEGATVDLVRGEKGWTRVAPEEDRADTAAVEELIRRLAGLEASLLFPPDRAPNPQLDAPWAEIDLWESLPLDAPPERAGPFARPPTLALSLGRRDPLNKTVFGRLAGDSTVLALPSSFLEGLPVGALAFRDRWMAAVTPANLANITLKAGHRELEVVAPPPGGAPTAWRLTRPFAAPADPEAMGRLLLALSNLRAAALITDRPEGDARFGLDSPSLVLAWTDRSEAQPVPLRASGGETTTLSVGSELPGKAGIRYARLSTSPIVFTLPPEILATFEAEWRDRQVMSFPIKGAERVTLRWPGAADGAGITLVARPVPDVKGNEPDWVLVDPPAGLSFDPARIKPLVASLARLATFKFAQYDGPIAAETGLDPGRFVVEVQVGPGRPRLLRVGKTTADGYLTATTEYGAAGLVFLLPLSSWEAWTKSPGVAATTAPGPAPSPTPAPAEPPK